MPRGVAIPGVKDALYDAAEALVLHAGPTRLTSRSVTARAGTATGLLFRHFAGFDDFLAAYLVDRVFRAAAQLAPSPADPDAAGTDGAVLADELCDLVLGGSWPALQASARLTAARPDLAVRVREVLGEQGTLLDLVEARLTDRLRAARRSGRLDRLGRRADPVTLARTLTALTHHAALDHPATAPARLPPLFRATLR